MPKKQARKVSAVHRVRRIAKHAVVPHKCNGHDPHVIRWKVLTIVLASVVALQVMPGKPVERLVLGEETDVTSQRLLDVTNEQRSKEGVAPLSLNKQLAAAATGKAKDMFTNQYWAHVSPDGTTPWYWFREVDYRYSYAGENLAKGFTTSSSLMTAWMDSLEHRENVLNPNYQDVGFAVVEGSLNGETTKLVVAMYGSPIRSGGGTTQTVLGASGEPSPIARIGMTLQSMSPAMLATIVLLMGLATISLWAHANRKYLPKSVQRSWKRHHGLYKAILTSGLVLLLIALYGGGQI